MREVRIRPGRANDIKRLDQLYLAAQWGTVGAFRERDKYLDAQERRRIVGAAMYWVEHPDAACDPNEPYAGQARLSLHEILVDPDQQRTGVGRRLVHAVTAAAHELGIEWIWAWPSLRGGAAAHQQRVAFFLACGLLTWITADGKTLVYGRADAVAERTAPSNSR